MLLAVKAKRSTLTSSASSGSAAASGSCVSMNLHCCRSLRATTKSVDFMALIPALFLPAIIAFADDGFATAILFKTAFGFSQPRSRGGAEAAFLVEIAKLAFEDLAAGLARQRVEELDVLRHLEIGEMSAQELLYRSGRQRRARFLFDAGEQPLAEFVVGNCRTPRSRARRSCRSARSRFRRDRC